MPLDSRSIFGALLAEVGEQMQDNPGAAGQESPDRSGSPAGATGSAQAAAAAAKAAQAKAEKDAASMRTLAIGAGIAAGLVGLIFVLRK